MSKPPNQIDRAGLGAAGQAAGLGCSIVVAELLCIGGGILLDKWLGTAPWFTLIGVALGLIAAGYQLYELTTVGRTDRAPGPIARQIGKVPIGRHDGGEKT